MTTSLFPTFSPPFISRWNITDVVPDAILEIRYHSTYNFVGTRVDGYLEPVALLTRQAADSLRAVSDDLKQQGYRLKIFDAYRPQCAVDHFMRWGADVSDTLMKSYFYPEVPRDSLFELGYIARRSGHTRGWKYIKIAWPYKKNEDGSFKTDENGEKVHFNYSIEGGYDWWAFLQQINAIIDKMTNSADKQLGYFFAKAKDDIISYDTFVSKVCFYLWNDIFKTYALDEQQGDLFKFTKKIKDKDENEKEVIGHLSFPEFYDGDGYVIKEVAEAFIGNVMRWGTDTKNDKA